jgi:putative MATE family efflux protein
MNSKFERDLSKGHIGKQLLLFSIPFIISNIIQALYNVVDMIVVGQFAGMESMSGVNIGGGVTILFTNLAVGLSAGATVLIAQYMGAGKRREMTECMGTLFTTLAVLAVVCTLVLLVFKNKILTAMHTPPESFDEAGRYLLVTSLGIVFIFGYNALSAVMRGLGDSKNPLKFVTVACIANIILDLVAVAVFKTGAFGAALATVISQGLSMLLCIAYLKRNNFVFSFTLEALKIKIEHLRLLLKVGIPTALQNIIVGISFIFLTSLTNTLGVAASAAVGAVGKFNGFGILPAIAMSMSVSAMSAQNLGAGKTDRALKTMKTGMFMAFFMSVAVYAVANLFPEQILAVFGSDEEMISLGVKNLTAFSFDYLIVAFTFCLNGFFIGAGHTLFSMVNASISAVLVRVPAAYIFGILLGKGVEGIGLAAPVASAVSACVGLMYLLSGRWKKAVIKH